MPAPLMPEARNLHREAQALIEQAVVQQAESSVSRIRQQGSARDDGGAQGPEPSVHAGGAAERPANPGRTPVKERILDTRGQAQDGDARNVINTRQTGNAETRATAGYHPRRGGCYDSLEDCSPTPEPPGTRVFSREIRTASSPSTSASPRRSTNTTGRRTSVYGSTTTAWRASWAEPLPMRSSSITYPCTSPTRRGRDSSTCRPARSTTWRIWSAPSWGTFRARTCALRTPGTYAHAPKSLANCSGTSYGASPSAARNSRVWPGPRSCMPSSRAPRAVTSCASSGAARRSIRTSCSISPPASLRRRGGGGDLR
jgi:hypothetical protein